MSRDRKEWIDVLRGIAMILVVLGHQVQGETAFFVLTSPIKMPLFFAISGYLFTIKDEKTFFINLFKRVIIPWFSLALIIYIPKLVIWNGDLLDYLLSLILGQKLWFMPCFVIAEIIHYFIRKYCKSVILVCVCSVVLTIVGLLQYNPDFTQSITRAFSVQLFFMLGYLFRLHENFLTKIDVKYIVVFCIVYIVLAIWSLALFPTECIDVHNFREYNFFYCLTLIIIGIFILFVFASKFDIHNKYLSWIGKNTLVIYIWHGTLISLLMQILLLCNYEFHNIWLGAVIKTIYALVVCCISAFLFNRFVPEIVGKSRHHSVVTEEVTNK